MSSLTSLLFPAKKKPIPLIVGILGAFVLLPMIAFTVLVIQGFIAQSGNEDPQDVTAINIQKSGATISWLTDKNNQAVVEYGISPDALHFYAPEVQNKKEHTVDLTLLTPATTYYYQLRINGRLYDNDGVPWSFTTKTKDGEDVAEAVKGIATRLPGAVTATVPPTPTVGLTTSSCDVVSCEAIQKKLGKGCSASDYFKCLATEGTPKAAGSTNSSAPTMSPTPTKTKIGTSTCDLKYLQLVNDTDCTKWTWDNFATKHPDCKNAFQQYVFQCSSKDFQSTNAEDIPTWYYNNAITNMTSNTATLTSNPPEGATVYCQVRAEDDDGNATSWQPESTICHYTPTPDPSS